MIKIFIKSQKKIKKPSYKIILNVARFEKQKSSNVTRKL